MADYELKFTVSSPGNYPTFVEFSPSGRFLVVGYRDSSLYILDRRAGFHPTLSATTPAIPTALVWETHKAFYVGFDDGSFMHYQLDLKQKKLAVGVVNSLFRGSFPVTAIALDGESKTLVLSVGPGVYAFRRTRTIGDFRFVAIISSRFKFLTSDPGSPASPIPRSICFTPNNTLVVTFCRQNIASIVLEFDGQHLRSSFQTVKIDYTGLPLLKAIASMRDEGVHQLTRCWIYGYSPKFPYIFINGGTATLSSTAVGTAIIRDTITQREIQSLKHTGRAGHDVSSIAYHVSTDKYSIVTADRGENATIKIWTTQRPSPAPQGRPNRGFLGWRCSIIMTLFVGLVIVARRHMGRFPNVSEILWFLSRILLILVQLCVQVGYTILEVLEDAATRLADTLELD